MTVSPMPHIFCGALCTPAEHGFMKLDGSRASAVETILSQSVAQIHISEFTKNELAAKDDCGFSLHL